MLYGILNLSLWGYIVALLILTHITVISVTLYLHRCQTHRGLDLHPIISHFFRFWLWLTTGQETKKWVAIHRKHHARCETAEDPHSPQILGLKKVFWEGAELYRAESKNAETLRIYGNGTPDDWMERHVYTKHSRRGVALMFVLDLLLFGIPGITIWAIQMMWIPLFAAGFVNGVGHYWGYRNFECPDEARNILPIGLFLGGEELHNNHHTYGTSAKFSIKWWEVDLGWGYINVFKALGLAKIRRVAPRPLVVKGKTHMDIDTLKTLISIRFQVMAHYKDDVLIPVLQEEMRKATATGKAILSRAKTALVRERSLVDAESKKTLVTALESRTTLQQVYQYREKLQDIWEWTAASPKELLDALQDWCRQAEATGIEALREFALQLQSYSLKTK